MMSHLLKITTVAAMLSIFLAACKIDEMSCEYPETISHIKKQLSAEATPNPVFRIFTGGKTVEFDISNIELLSETDNINICGAQAKIYAGNDTDISRKIAKENPFTELDSYTLQSFLPTVGIQYSIERKGDKREITIRAATF